MPVFVLTSWFFFFFWKEKKREDRFAFSILLSFFLSSLSAWIRFRFLFSIFEEIFFLFLTLIIFMWENWSFFVMGCAVQKWRNFFSVVCSCAAWTPSIDTSDDKTSFKVQKESRLNAFTFSFRTLIHSHQGSLWNYWHPTPPPPRNENERFMKKLEVQLVQGVHCGGGGSILLLEIVYGLWSKARVDCTHLINQSMTASSRTAMVLPKNVTESSRANGRCPSLDYPKSRIELASFLAIITQFWRIRCIGNK